MRARKPKAVRNEARGTWVCFPVVDGKRTSRKLGNLNELTQTEADMRASEMMCSLRLRAERTSPTVGAVVAQYREDRLSKLRHSTRKSAESWLKSYVLKRWEQAPISDLQPRNVQLWLESLSLAPRTRGHVKGLLSCLVNYAMWAGMIPVGSNPLSLVTVKGSSKRTRKPHNLTVTEKSLMLAKLREPFRTMMQIQLCLGLRVSELLALRWQDVDWMGSWLNVEHGIVAQVYDSVKTDGSLKRIALDPEPLDALKDWKQSTQFSMPEDWIFASPAQLGRLPWSYTAYKEALQTAAAAVGMGSIGTHSLRHTYCSWLRAEKTDPETRQKLMRHTDPRTTLMYGESDTDAMQEANRKISRRVFDSKLIPGSASH